MKRFSLLIAAMLALMLLVAGCSKADAPATGKVYSGELTVEMKNLKFVPNTFTVKKGTKVTFVNKDALLHDVVQIEVKQLGKGNPSFDSGAVAAGSNWSVTFDKPGTYPILCTQSSHWAAGMTGTVTVVE